MALFKFALVAAIGGDADSMWLFSANRKIKFKITILFGGIMKVASLFFGLMVLTSVSEAAQSVTAKPPSLLKIVPSAKVQAIDSNGLYLVTLTCRVAPIPEQNVNILEKKVRQSALTLTFSNARAGANQAPSSSTVLAAIPVFGVTISRGDPPSFFKNGGCNQSFLITGRTPLYLTGVWTDQQSSTPSALTTALVSIAGLVAPLSPLFPTGPANLIKGDTGIANSMAAPFTQLVAATNWSETETETTAELRETTYKVTAWYFTKTFLTGSGLIKPAANVSITIKRIRSMQVALTIPAVSVAYQATIQSFVSLVQGNAATCIAIGRALELNQNFTHQDAVSALAQIVVLSGITSDKVQTCLGTAYGPEVIQDSYWIKNSHMTLTKDSFTDQLDVTPFSPVVFDLISSAMTNYAAGKHNNVDIDEYFAPQMIVTDATSLIGSSTNSSMEQILDSLKATPGAYQYYGCPQSDSAKDPNNNNPDVAYVLAIDKTLKQENMVIMRMWWKLDQSNAQPRIYEISLGVEGNLVKSALVADNNQCGLGVKIPSQ